MVAGLPAFYKPLNAIVSTAVAQLLQALVETMGRTAARPRQLCLQFQPLRQLCLELPQLGRDRLHPCIARFLYRLQMPAYRWPRDSHLPGDGGNRLLLDQMAPADFVNDVHVKHSRYLRRNTGWLHTGVETIGRCFHPESGKFCTLFDNLANRPIPIWATLKQMFTLTLTQVLRDAAAARSTDECEEISFSSWNSSGFIWAGKGGAH